MARTRNPTERIKSLLDAGTEVFRRKDFKRAQMSDVATEMGCSTGTLYNYVENKEALFEHVVLYGMTGTLPDPDLLPLELPEPGSTFAMIVHRGQELSVGGAIRQASEGQPPDDPAAQITRLANGLFDFFANYHPVIEVMETSVLDYPDLADTYNHQRETLIFGPWIALIEQRCSQGAFRAIKDPEWTAKLTVEMIAICAWKERGHTDLYDEPRARSACLDQVLTMLLKDKDR